jgi:hypothetical protein
LGTHIYESASSSNPYLPALPTIYLYVIVDISEIPYFNPAIITHLAGKFTPAANVDVQKIIFKHL